MITKLNEWAVRGMLATVAILAFLICFLVCADVIGRVVFNSPVKGTPEIVSFSILVIGTFLAKCGAARDLFALTNRLTKKTPVGSASLPCWRTRCLHSSPACRLASLGDIFRGCIPYWICLLSVIVVIAAFPQLATWLPNLGNVVAK